MTVKTIQGDLFESGAEMLVNPVNTIGFMGALAGVFEQRFPDDSTEYKEYCEAQGMQEGEVFCTDRTGVIIAHFATVKLPGGAASLNRIQQGLQDLEWLLDNKFDQVNTIAIPAIGCGVGGLDFEDVQSEVESIFWDHRVTVLLYRPRS